MDCAIDATSAQQRRVSRVYYRVHVQARYVADDNHNAPVEKRCFSPGLRHWIRSQAGNLSGSTHVLRRAA